MMITKHGIAVYLSGRMEDGSFEVGGKTYLRRALTSGHVAVAAWETSSATAKAAAFEAMSQFLADQGSTV